MSILKRITLLHGVIGIIVVVVGAALFASFTHTIDWTMAVLPNGKVDEGESPTDIGAIITTPKWFGWVNAIISELTPVAGSLYLFHAHQTKAPQWPGAVMLGFGICASAVGQLYGSGATFVTDPFFAFVAGLLPVTAATLLLKVLFMVISGSAPDAPNATAPILGPQTQVSHHQNAGPQAPVSVHHPVPGAFTAPPVNAPAPADEPPVHTFTEPAVNAVEEAVHTEAMDKVEVVHDTDVHAAQEPCTPPVNAEPEAPVNKPSRPTVNKPKKTVHKPKPAAVNADREQLRRRVHELRKTETVRDVAEQLGISTGLVNKLSKEPLEPPVNVDEVAEAELKNVDWESGLAEILGHQNDDET